MDRPFLYSKIPSYCFTPNTLHSLQYFLKDTISIIVLYNLGFYIQNTNAIIQCVSWPLFWFAQGTLFWAYFVIGHDCGHRSFSKNIWINDLIGIFCHSVLLVPFYSWKISHRRHHLNTGNYEREEAFRPIHYSKYTKMKKIEKIIRFKCILFLFPLYLLFLRNDHFATHYLPNPHLFKKNEYPQVILSSLCCLVMFIILCIVGYLKGLTFLVYFYILPYLVFSMWISFVTYMQHTDLRIPWYPTANWSSLKGAFSSIDRNYGFFDAIQHNTGNYHVIHHLFPGIPHYHLKTARHSIFDYVKDQYLIDDQPVLLSFLKSFQNCIVIPNGQLVAYYQNIKKESGRSLIE